jgi:copper chaperone CopZ
VLKPNHFAASTGEVDNSMTNSSQSNMKLLLLIILSLTCFATATQGADKPAITTNATNRFTITGMHCDGCAGGLTAELKTTRGVANAQVTFSNKLAIVVYDTNRITLERLTKVIKEAGLEAKPIKP